MEKILDVNGKELRIGDDVLYTSYQNEDFHKGKIIKTSPAFIYCNGINLRYKNNYDRDTRIKRGHADWRIIKL